MAVVDRLWGFCNVLRHDGVDYSDYIEQLSYLLFIKMAAERKVALNNKANWEALRRPHNNSHVLSTYRDVLYEMGKSSGSLGEIFQGAEPRINSAASFQKLIALIDETNWSSLGIDVQAAVFEGLLERAAAEGKKGAGQYFTPRPLIQSIIRCIMPELKDVARPALADPACGTGGFLSAACEWFSSNTPTVRPEFYGVDLVSRPRRLALMNMYLHGAEATIEIGDSIYETPTRTFDMVVTNPPFGSQGVTGPPERSDFAVRTSNKQLNFLQHVISLLRPSGSAAIIVPDNVLFSSQAAAVLRDLTARCNLHTILRCPNGTFTPYTQGTKTNVMFFTKGQRTEVMWIYDCRTDIPPVSRTNPLTAEHFAEFEKCYRGAESRADPRHQSDSVIDRWRPFAIAAVDASGYRIDSLRWLTKAVADHGNPLVLVREAITRLQEASDQLQILEGALRERI
jgi:type I restriction enzyme M protein